MRKLPEEQPLLQLQANDSWHLRNLEQWLAPAIEYAAQGNIFAVHKAWEHDFAGAESQRLKDRAAIMEQYGIERYPHQHKGREGEILRAIRANIAARMEQERKEVA